MQVSKWDLGGLSVIAGLACVLLDQHSATRMSMQGELLPRSFLLLGDADVDGIVIGSSKSSALSSQQDLTYNASYHSSSKGSFFRESDNGSALARFVDGSAPVSATTGTITTRIVAKGE